MEVTRKLEAFDRYTVLAHKFDTFDEAKSFLIGIVKRGNCVYPPSLWCWSDGDVVEKWHPFTADCEVSLICEESKPDFTYHISDEMVSRLNDYEYKAEENDEDTIFVVRIRNYYYAVGSSALNIENNFKTELQNKDGVYVTRFRYSDLEKVLKRFIASGYKFGVVENMESTL